MSVITAPSALECASACANASVSFQPQMKRPILPSDLQLRRRGLAQNRVDDLAMDIGEPVISALEPVGQTLVIDAHQVQNGGVQVMD